MVKPDQRRGPARTAPTSPGCQNGRCGRCAASVQMIYQDPYESLDPRFRVQPDGRGADARARHRPVVGRAAASWSSRRWSRRACPRPTLTWTGTRTSCLAASASGSRSPRRWCLARSCCWPTSPCRCWTSRSGPACCRCSTVCAATADMAILMITHDLSTAAHFADRIAVMYLGRIVELGTASEVVRNPQHPYTKALLSVVPEARPAGPDGAADPQRRDAGPGRRPARLPVPSALPDRRRPMQDRRTRCCGCPLRARQATWPPVTWPDHDRPAAGRAARPVGPRAARDT